MISQYIFIFLLKICLYCVHTVLSQKEQRLVNYQHIFILSFVRKYVGTVYIQFLVLGLDKNWPVGSIKYFGFIFILWCLVNFLIFRKISVLQRLIFRRIDAFRICYASRIFFHSLFCCTPKVYLPRWCNNMIIENLFLEW